MAEMDCSLCNKWCDTIDINSIGCNLFCGCMASILASVMIGFYIAIPIINIVAMFWYTETFDNVMYFYLTTVCYECLLQFLISIPTWSILLDYPSNEKLRYVVPYYYPISFGLMICNSTLSMLKCNVGYKTNLSLFVVGRIMVTIFGCVFYHQAGGEKMKKQQEKHRLERLKNNPNPGSALVQNIYFVPQYNKINVQPRMWQENDGENDGENEAKHQGENGENEQHIDIVIPKVIFE